MKRLSITFYDETHDKLETNAKTKHLSLAEYVRQLVETGLKVEALSNESKAEENPMMDLLNTLRAEQQAWAKKIIPTLHESLYLNRFVVANLNEGHQKESQQFLRDAKMKAQGISEALFQQEDELGTID